jgi:hypothetical protein
MAARVRPARGLGAIRLAVASVTFALVAAGCATSDLPSAVPPPPSGGPDMTVTPAVGLTRGEIVAALGTQNLVLADSQAAVRPAEAPLLGAAPRAVYQVLLPKDPTRGFIVVYEFADTGLAAAAATEQQAYLGTGPGRVQRPQGTVTVIRQVGSTVVLYEWLPGASQDPSAAGIQAALETLGTSYPVPN